jgi:hypothetical protein
MCHDPGNALTPPAIVKAANADGPLPRYHRQRAIWIVASRQDWISASSDTAGE